MFDTEAVQRLRRRWTAIRQGLVEYYAGPYRQTLAREGRDEDDLFALIVLGEALGVPDPAAYYSAELMPMLTMDFHEWHRRMGMPRSPLDHVSCC
ncbi:hypothetical protein FM104_12280 [Microbacterium esteraromaticum]|uniref:DNA helicase n=1 Tax=Microbacterium esteraromaticum TaxID=57043 RepID=A0A1R4KFA8_9MICO|nr:cory-CC-star protein [Microbacterium esteraromaticum]SJN42989.1 hypothetical protein FM104_12280 [Microbacterium esteraromaticum]